PRLAERHRGARPPRRQVDRQRMSRPSPKVLQKIRALVLDVDGVLTDGGMYYGPGGEGLKRFNVKDGMGIALILEAGIAVALISGENSEILRRRAEKLKIADIFIGIEDKLKTMETFLAGKKI